MQPLWHHYYSEASAVLFVVDAAAAAKVAEAAIILFGLLQHEQLQVRYQIFAVPLSATVALQLLPQQQLHLISRALM